MDDPRLIEKLRSLYLVPPPNKTDLNLDNPTVIDTSMGQAEKIREILGNKKNGFFIECGALDGEVRSNTLNFERFHNWTGLLIEADPLNYANMVKKNRKAWLSQTCLSIHPYPEIVSFEQNYNIGKISSLRPGSVHKGHTDVQCFPFYTFLLALNIKQVDYFSLDVEGSELDVLRTIPFDKVDIKTLSVEFVHVDKGKQSILDFMASKNYRYHSNVTHPDWLANDFIFTKV
ncbi:protein Star isoform X2 [Nilaparvata lugens]|nr:protein Star isoform X2 [Nilaparvata lugens]XP_039286318.1 protein Star isoform X2 [Nilaparvata lugens]